MTFFTDFFTSVFTASEKMSVSNNVLRHQNPDTTFVISFKLMSTYKIVLFSLSALRKSF